MNIHPVIAQVTARIEQRSRDLRADYTARMQAQTRTTPARARLSCSNLAHVMAASGDDKPALGFGGFPNIALMEDIALSKRMKAWGPPLCLRTPVVTSGRRWMEHGVWKTIFLMWRLRWQYWLGADPNTLARHYRAQGEH